MGVRLASVSSTAVVSATLVTTTEAVVVTAPAINLTVDNALVLVFWFVRWTPGAGTTSVNARLRRGTTTTGTQVNADPSQAVTAGAATISTGSYSDTPGVVAGQQYSITLAQVAATANGAVSDVSLVVMVL